MVSNTLIMLLKAKAKIAFISFKANIILNFIYGKQNFLLFLTLKFLFKVFNIFTFFFNLQTFLHYSKKLKYPLRCVLDFWTFGTNPSRNIFAALVVFPKIAYRVLLYCYPINLFINVLHRFYKSFWNLQAVFKRLSAYDLFSSGFSAQHKV